jgi:hypothetical protein
MKRKRLLLTVGFLALLLLGGYVTLRLATPRHRITKENIDAIEFGMTEREVEVFSGCF